MLKQFSKSNYEIKKLSIFLKESNKKLKITHLFFSINYL